MKLYSYSRSSASFRVRIALALKGLAYDYVPIHLPSGGQFGDDYASVSAQQLVPVLETADGLRLSQSLAIMEYLDETHPQPPLLPKDAAGRARVRALAQAVACEIHPLNNLRVLKYLVREVGAADEVKDQWYRHWVETGLEAVERALSDGATGLYCHGDMPTLADCTLVPQIFNAQRFKCRLDHVPTVMRVFEQCMTQLAFEASQPSRCPDFQA